MSTGDPHTRPVRDGVLMLIGAAFLGVQVAIRIFLDMDLTQA
jgi:hypothetical protein